MALIDVTGLVKLFPGGVVAVDDIDFQVEEGEIFGFLGPNGAGKTTTIRILVTLLAPTEGTARIGGIDVTAAPEEIRKRVGYAAQFIGVDDDLTARENMVLQARLHGLGRTEAGSRSDDLLEILQLTDVAHRRAGTFSGGMRRRLDLGQALAHDPSLLFLDEPTTGLDPQNRRALWSYLRELNGRGVTIFLTTQYMEEADELTGRLAIIDHGRIAVLGTPDELKEELGGDVVTVSVEDSAEVIDRAVGLLTPLADGDEVQVVGADIQLVIGNAAERLAEVVRSLDAAGLAPIRLEVAEPTLDDVFLRHTGEKMRVDEVKPRSKMSMRPRHR